MLNKALKAAKLDHVVELDPPFDIGAESVRAACEMYRNRLTGMPALLIYHPRQQNYPSVVEALDAAEAEGLRVLAVPLPDEDQWMLVGITGVLYSHGC